MNINHHCLPLIVSFLVAEFKGHRSKKTLTSEGVLFGHHIIDKYFASKAHFGCAHHLHKKRVIVDYGGCDDFDEWVFNF